MSDEWVKFEFLENDYSESNIRRKRQRMSLRAQADAFELEDREFIRQYRLSKPSVQEVCEEIRPMMRETRRSSDLSVETKVLTALSFYANGSYQRTIGSISAHYMAQQTVSSAVAQVTACLNSSAMRRKYVVFPKSQQERSLITAEFEKKFNMAGVIGCIDCTQVAIIRPSQHEERYYCRKHYHSLNVQLICDANMQITSVDASYGGATHDSFIWNNHPIKSHLESLNESVWLLGDSGYPLRRYIMTPVVNALPNTPEAYYTEMHVRARTIVERTIGLLKARFRCLLVHRVLHYTPKVAASIVNACVILHNICNKANTEVPELSDADLQQEAQLQPEGEVHNPSRGNNPDLQLGQATRQDLIQRLWQARAT